MPNALCFEARAHMLEAVGVNWERDVERMCNLLATATNYTRADRVASNRVVDALVDVIGITFDLELLDRRAVVKHELDFDALIPLDEAGNAHMVRELQAVGA